MPNYTVLQALALEDLSDDARNYLERLNKSGIDKIKGKIFTATNQQNLKRQIEEMVAHKAENDTVKLNDCLNIVRSLCKGTKDDKRLISPKELFPILEDVKMKIVADKKLTKVSKLIDESGMTETQIIEWFKNRKK